MPVRALSAAARAGILRAWSASVMVYSSGSRCGARSETPALRSVDGSATRRAVRWFWLVTVRQTKRRASVVMHHCSLLLVAPLPGDAAGRRALTHRAQVARCELL